MREIPSVAWLAALSRLDPEKTLGAPPDWEEAVQVLARHGLAPIAAYNLQFRMPFAEVPEACKDFLLGYLQGVGNDNVFKLMQLKDLVGDLDLPALLLDGAAFVDSLYPHVSFRAVPELRLLVHEADVPRFRAALAEERFVEMEGDEPDPDDPVSLYNDRFFLKLYPHLLPGRRDMSGIWERAVPAPVFGAAVARPEAEDALLLHVLSMARRAFALPLIYWVDLRELVLGASPIASGRGPGAPLRPEVVRERAAAYGAERALWAAMELLAHFQPTAAEAARALQPALSAPTRAMIAPVVVEPAKAFDRERQLRGLDKLVRLLVG